ncbi:MAG: DUF1700 domain-containing protein [Clostridia bacterium]|nr:DUF1700 domain-containing protein [Clostridia bacterium]
MNKQAFLEELKGRLGNFPAETVQKTYEYYAELIDDAMEEGLSEQEAVARLGSLDDIVASVLETTPLPRLIETRVKEKRRRMSAWEVVLLVLGAPVWLPLLLALGAVALSLVACLVAVDISIWAAALAVPLCGVLFMGAGLFAAGLELGLRAVYFGGGLAVLGLGVGAVLLAVLLSQGFVKLCRWIGRSIKNLFVKKGGK